MHFFSYCHCWRFLKNWFLHGRIIFPSTHIHTQKKGENFSEGEDGKRNLLCKQKHKTHNVSVLANISLVFFFFFTFLLTIHYDRFACYDFFCFRQFAERKIISIKMLAACCCWMKCCKKFSFFLISFLHLFFIFYLYLSYKESESKRMKKMMRNPNINANKAWYLKGIFSTL